MKRLFQPHFLWLGAVCAAYFAGYNSRPRPAPYARDLTDPHELAAALHAHDLHLRYVHGGVEGAAYLTEGERAREELLSLPGRPDPAWAGVVRASRLPPWDTPQEGVTRVGGLALFGDPTLVEKIAQALR